MNHRPHSPIHLLPPATGGLAAALLLFFFGTGCGDDSGADSPPSPDAGDDGMGRDGGPSPTDAGPPDAGPLREVACQDESIATLMLFETPSPRGVIASEGGPVWTETIDATAGGISADESYVYLRFTERGLEKVDLSDEAAFVSLAWDIAFRRFVIRLNSGVSGPGDVVAARTAPETSFDGLDVVPEGLAFREERYFTDTCEYVSDGSGIGSPATALASYWTYPGCVSMTGNVFVLRRGDGRHVKFEVLRYYPPENQRSCDDTSMISFPSGGGNVAVQWAFLD